MSSVDIGIQRGEFVIEGVADETLRGEMVALFRRDVGYQAIDTGKAFERRGMQGDAVAHGAQAEQAMLRVFQSYPADGAMDLITFLQKKLRQIRSILAGNPGNQRASTHKC